MFDHVSIGVRDIARAKRFYDAALAPLGYKCLRDSPNLLGYGAGEVALWISPTGSPVPPVGNSPAEVSVPNAVRVKTATAFST